jgi:hypothetical protein
MSTCAGVVSSGGTKDLTRDSNCGHFARVTLLPSVLQTLARSLLVRVVALGTLVHGWRCEYIPVQIGASSFSFRATVIHQTLESSLLCIVGYVTKFGAPFGAKKLDPAPFA